MSGQVAVGPVVVGVDGSPSCLAAVETAAREAQRRGVQLQLAHALSWTGRVTPGVPPWDPDGDEVRELVNGALTMAEGRARRVAPKVAITREVLVGEPGTVLESESRTASLTVVGSSPPSPLRGLRHVSVAGHLTQHGRGPVLVVCGRPTRTGPVVLAEDGTPGVRAAAEFAFAEAQARDTDLVVVHSRGERRRSETPAPGSDLTDLVRKYPYLRIRSRWIRHRAHRALIDASAGAQLIVLPAHPRHTPALPLTADHTILRRALCPVAVIPAGRG
ncbi:universal stress protein [Streptomyces sp. YIM S03343]